MFRDWISRPHVAEWWVEPPIAEIEAWCDPSADDRGDAHHVALLDGAAVTESAVTPIMCIIYHLDTHYADKYCDR